MKNVALIADAARAGPRRRVPDNGQLTGGPRRPPDAHAALPARVADLRAVVKSPTVPRRRSLARRIESPVGPEAGLTSITAELLALLAQGGKLALLPQIAAAAGRALDRRLGVHQALVTTALPLDEATRRRLVASLEKMTGRNDPPGRE